MPDLPGFDFIYNSHTGAVQQYPSPIASAVIKAGLGWHGPFKTERDALDFYNRNKASHPDWAEPTGVLGNIKNIPGAITGQVNAATEGVKGIFGLSNADITSWLIRIGEIMLGLVLVAVGIAKLTGVDNTIVGMIKAGAKVA
jgi:hypothetical protein